MELIKFKKEFISRKGSVFNGVFIKHNDNFSKIVEKATNIAFNKISSDITSIITPQDYTVISTNGFDTESIKQNIDIFDPKELYPENKRINIELLQDDEIDVTKEELQNHYIRAILCLKYFEELHKNMADTFESKNSIEDLINEFLKLKILYDEQVSGTAATTVPGGQNSFTINTL